MVPLRVLVVDDDPNNVEILVVILKGLGHEVATAADGPTAVRIADTWHPDVVFMDGVMPGAYDGVEATRRLKEAGFQGAVVLQSAKASNVDMAHGLSAGADAYLTKPFRRQDVLHLLERFSVPAPM